MLSVYFQIDTKLTPLREPGLMRVFNKIMLDSGVYKSEPGIVDNVSALKEVSAESGDNVAEDKCGASESKEPKA